MIATIKERVSLPLITGSESKNMKSTDNTFQNMLSNLQDPAAQTEISGTINEKKQLPVCSEQPDNKSFESKDNGVLSDKDDNDLSDDKSVTQQCSESQSGFMVAPFVFAMFSQAAGQIGCDTKAETKMTEAASSLNSVSPDAQQLNQNMSVLNQTQAQASGNTSINYSKGSIEVSTINVSTADQTGTGNTTFELNMDAKVKGTVQQEDGIKTNFEADVFARTQKDGVVAQTEESSVPVKNSVIDIAPEATGSLSLKNETVSSVQEKFTEATTDLKHMDKSGKDSAALSKEFGSETDIKLTSAHQTDTQVHSPVGKTEVENTKESETTFGSNQTIQTDSMQSGKVGQAIGKSAAWVAAETNQTEQSTVSGQQSLQGNSESQNPFSFADAFTEKKASIKKPITNGVHSVKSSETGEKPAAETTEMLHSPEGAPPIQNVGPKAETLLTETKTNNTHQAVFEQVSNNIQGALKSDRFSFDMKLKPDGLGQVKVKLTCENGIISLDIQTHSEETHKLLAGQLNQLKESLAANNYEVSHLNVNLLSDGKASGGWQDSSAGFGSSQENGNSETWKTTFQSNEKTDTADASKIHNRYLAGVLNYTV
ncbi:MAG: flagellar hook-length control protein FliK [Clostridiales bacterium]|nr:flagellar hook-length control protein FliK [Clostridiales bacterium]